MMTSNVYHRVFYLKYKLATGTCFTLDIDDRQYIVTARHVISGINDGDEIAMFHNGNWLSSDVRVVGLGSIDDISDDIAVLSIKYRMSPPMPMEATSAGLIFGQDVYFLGFPYGLYTDTDVMRGFPLPLVKKAIVSGRIGSSGRPEIFLLDGHNNPGFSGGPVVFTKPGRTRPDYKVLGVVSGYRLHEGDVYLNGKPTGLKHAENSGTIIAPSIKRATEMIIANPIGLPLNRAVS
jgi:hypothetical protein